MMAAPIRNTSLASLVSRLIGGAFLGKVFGFFREIAMARVLGASVVADSFRASVTAILLPINPLMGELIPAVLVPLHRRWAEEGKAPALSASLGATFLLAALGMTGAVWGFAGWWADVLVAGFSQEAHDVTVRFIKIMALAMPATVLTAFVCCIEISVRRSRITALRAVVQNGSVMAGIAIMAVNGQPTAIAWAFVLSMSGLGLWGGAQLWYEGELQVSAVRPSLAAAALKTFLGRARPLLSLPFAEQGNLLVERLMASGIGVGAVASLDYARSFTECATFLISMPIGLAVLSLARTDDARRTQTQIDMLMRLLLCIGLPISIFVAVFADDVVHVVLQRGAFDAHAAEMTAAVLRGIAMGLWANTLGLVLIRMLNAGTRNLAAAAAIVASFAANVLVNVAATPSLGTFALGLGEGARGIVLLACTSVMLSQGRALLRHLCVSFPVIAIAAACAALVHGMTEAPMVRIAGGGALLTAAATAWLVWSAPELPRMAVARLRAVRAARAVLMEGR